MTSEQRDSIIRDSLKVVGGLLLITGYVSTDMWDNITMIVLTSAGVLMVVGPIVWGYVAKTTKGILQSAEALPDVEKIVVNDPKLASSLGPKVTT